ncbi:MAG: arylsulfatase, partial [Planctomycetes bacterium]|nr:arylsulfatase [Planctomycetota bacterium]
MADDLGYRELGCFGQQRIATPHIDALAAQGMRLTRHYSGAPVCAPSRCVLMTGKHPGHAAVRDNKEAQPEGQWPLPAGEVLWPALLQGAGYATGAFGKWGLGMFGTSGDPLRRGFDHFYGYNCQRHAHSYWPAYLWDDDQRVPLRNEPPVPGRGRLRDGQDAGDPKSYAQFFGSDYAPDRILAAAVAFVAAHRERPFCLYYPSVLPHLALQVPETEVAVYAGKFAETPYLGQNGYTPHRTPRAAYAAMVSRFDAEVGTLVAALEQAGIAGRTLVVVTSDNGATHSPVGGTDVDFFASCGELRGRKGSLYEGGVRVPTVVRWPGVVPAGSESEFLSGFEDWLPTLAALCGARVPEGCDGISLLPTLRGERQEPRRFLYREFAGYGGWQAVWMGDHKLVRRNLQEPSKALRELYDLRTDPGETRDLATEQAERLAAFEVVLAAEHQPSATFPLRAVDEVPPPREPIRVGRAGLEVEFTQSPAFAWTSLRHEGRELLRAVRPCAQLVLDGRAVALGGLLGQRNHAFLSAAERDQLRADPGALVCTGVTETPIAERMRWARTRPAAPDAVWPPLGTCLTATFAAPPTRPELQGLVVRWHCEVHDALPLLGVRLEIENRTGRSIELDRLTTVELACVEGESRVDPAHTAWRLPPLHVETDFAFGGMTAGDANHHVVHWVADPDYATQVHYERQTPCLLQVRPELGPAQTLAPGAVFRSWHSWLLCLDPRDRERQDLAVKQMYRVLAPWVTENPLMMHVRNSDPAAVRLAIEQCAEVGFEMAILTFGSGFDVEDRSEANLARWRELADHAHRRGVQLGGYSLLSSRRIEPDGDNCLDLATGKPGGQRFGYAPALASAWGQAYFAQLYRFFEQTGFDLLEHDGSYPGDFDAAARPPLQRGHADSQWVQYGVIRDYYRWCRERGIYLNVPDYYYLAGANKCGMGYRETNWSLPRAEQVLHTRQNLFDGTRQKTPSMGWMFVPLTEYQGGGAAATVEPLDAHREHYQRMLIANLAYGAQACYRGPRLYDTEATKQVVVDAVQWFKAHRVVLESDVVHTNSRRPDGRDLDWVFHAAPGQRECGMLVVWNPLEQERSATIALDLSFCGLAERVRVVAQGAAARNCELDRR